VPIGKIQYHIGIAFNPNGHSPKNCTQATGGGGGSIPPPHSKSAVSVKLLNILVYFFLKKQMNRFETFWALICLSILIFSKKNLNLSKLRFTVKIRSFEQIMNMWIFWKNAQKRILTIVITIAIAKKRLRNHPRIT